MPLFLAENFAGMWIWVFGVPAVLSLLAVGSLPFSARGHWSGVVLAAPALLIGGLLLFFAVVGHAPAWYVIVSTVPVALGVGSMKLWAARRREAE